MLCQRKSSNLHALLLQVGNLLGYLSIGLVASIPLRAQVRVKLCQLVLWAGDHGRAAVRDQATHGLLSRPHVSVVAETHLLHSCSLADGNASEVHAPMDLADGGEELLARLRVQAQHAIGLAIEAHGEATHTSSLRVSWDLDVKLARALVGCCGPQGLCLLWGRSSKSQNALEGSHQLQSLVNHQQQAVLHERVRVANADLVRCDLRRNLAAAEGQQHRSRQILGLRRGPHLRLLGLVLRQVKSLGPSGACEALAPVFRALFTLAVHHNAVVAARVCDEVELLGWCSNHHLN
mmetsp:Transcript_18113/g.34000  ORF Transcript_18113/g.34000 Transcript_18113/m.34000 type:complete len:292 (+) Transcript_18113:127-1002(+)